MSGRGVRLAGWIAAAALCPAVVPCARAQGGVLVEGVADVELWKTDSLSALLARNGGRPATVGRLGLWAAAEPVRDVVLFGQVGAETGPVRGRTGTRVRAMQYGARWSPRQALVLEAGTMPHVVGAFASRWLSFRNPLIGSPDGYTLAYPVGVKVSGTASVVDWRAAVLSRPLVNDAYTVEPSHAPRPAVGAGITPTTGLRLGMSASAGPYLNCDLPPTLLAGSGWRAYRQRIVAADAQVSRGYFEGHAEVARASYDVPGRGRVAGTAWYVETKYTVAPRLYAAVRVERNDYPYVMPLNATTWIVSQSDFADVEAGAGFRLDASTLLKLTVRADRWTPNPNPSAPQANGRAVAMQLSRTFAAR